LYIKENYGKMNKDILNIKNILKGGTAVLDCGIDNENNGK